jgi:hypothetical protein
LVGAWGTGHLDHVMRSGFGCQFDCDAPDVLIPPT